MASSRTVLCVALLGMVSFGVGCSNLLYNLQPYRLQRLNRGSAPSLDPEFTRHDRSAPHHQMIGQAPAVDDSKLTGNTATIVSVRAQSSD